MIRTYIVNFYYGTDLRRSEEVSVCNEITALALALDKFAAGGWVTDSPFRIEIKIKD